MARFTSLVLILVSTIALAADPATNPSTTKVKRGTLNLKVSAAGAFEPVDPFELRLRFKAYQGDLIVVSAAAPGASVAKGDTILQLDDTQIKRQLAGAENDLAVAKANYDKAQSDVALGDASAALAMKIQQEELANTQGALKWWENVDGKHMLEDADLSVLYSQDSVDDQQDELNELKKMYKSEELTSATADIVVKRAIRSLRNSKTHLEQTEESADKTRKDDYEVQHERMKYAVDQQQEALDQLKSQQTQAKILRDSALVSAKIALDSSEEHVADLKSDAEEFVIHSPQSMTIYYGQLSNGSWQNNNPKLLGAGEKIILLPPHLPPGVQITGVVPGKLKFVADVSEDKILLLKKSQKATVTPTAMPQLSLDATVADPMHVVVDGSNFNVAVNFAADVDQIAPGMKGTLKVEPQVTDQVLLVPETAVKDGKVWVRQPDGSDKSMEVTTGRSDGESIEIVRGLGEGDEVLTAAK